MIFFEITTLHIFVKDKDGKTGKKLFQDSGIHKLIPVFGLGNTECCNWQATQFSYLAVDRTAQDDEVSMQIRVCYSCSSISNLTQCEGPRRFFLCGL